MKYWIWMALLVGGFGCDDGGDGDGSGGGAGGAGAGGEAGEEELFEEGCEHMKEGPTVDVAAKADAMGAPSVALEHTRVEIGLAAGRFVSFPADEEGDYVFFLSDDVPLTVTQGGVEVAFEESAPVDACGEVAVHHVIELSVGLATIEIGTTDQTSVGFVWEHAGEAHEHGDGA